MGALAGKLAAHGAAPGGAAGGLTRVPGAGAGGAAAAQRPAEGAAPESPFERRPLGGGGGLYVRVVCLGEPPPSCRPEFWLLGLDGEPFPLNIGYTAEVTADLGHEAAHFEAGVKEAAGDVSGEWEHIITISVEAGEEGPVFRAGLHLGTGFKRRARRGSDQNCVGDLETVWTWAQEQYAQSRLDAKGRGFPEAATHGLAGGLEDVSAVQGLGLLDGAVQCALRGAAARGTPEAPWPTFIRISEVVGGDRTTSPAPTVPSVPALLGLDCAMEVGSKRPRTSERGTAPTADAGTAEIADVEASGVQAGTTVPQAEPTEKEFAVEGPSKVSVNERLRSKVRKTGQLYLHHVASHRTGPVIRVDSGLRISVRDVMEVEMQPLRSELLQQIKIPR